MTSGESEILRVARDALWLPHRYDPGQDAIHFVRTPRDVHRKATFLIDEYLPADAQRIVVRRIDALAAAPKRSPVNFIFHSAFCCSTLLARAVDVEGTAMGLKEPVILNDIVGWKRRGGQPAEIARALEVAIAMLERPFRPGESIVIKPSNVINCFIPALLAGRPAARALLLHAPLDTFLKSIAKKGLWGRHWVRDLLIKLLKDGLVELGFSADDYLGLTDLQVAAVGWLAQQALFADTVKRFGLDRVRTLDSETLVTRPDEAMTALSGLFGLGLDRDAIAGIVAGPAFTQHSKFGNDFGSDSRAAEYRDAAELHRDEIEKVGVWAAAVAANAGVAMELRAPLLG